MTVCSCRTILRTGIGITLLALAVTACVTEGLQKQTEVLNGVVPGPRAYLMRCMEQNLARLYDVRSGRSHMVLRRRPNSLYVARLVGYGDEEVVINIEFHDVGRHETRVAARSFRARNDPQDHRRALEAVLNRCIR